MQSEALLVLLVFLVLSAPGCRLKELMSKRIVATKRGTVVVDAVAAENRACRLSACAAELK
jgi:hypothetical protein